MQKADSWLGFWMALLLGLTGISEGKPMPAPKAESVRSYTITENDTTVYVLHLALDGTGQPAYFFRNVFTPVCLTGECKPVYINFYWDLLGNYTRFDFPPGEELTKMDHKPFKPEDYEKLQTILANTNSLFKQVAMEDLVGKGTENLADSVDAKAGATLKTVKNEVIEGAVYTCYTLWHIAHGKVVSEMQRITESYRNEALLHRFLTGANHHYQYWALDRVLGPGGQVPPTFAADVQGVVRGKNIFTARYALQKVAPDFWNDPQRQRWLWDTYLSAGYTLQLAILKKLTTIRLLPTLTEPLAGHLPNANPEQFTLLLNLLAAQPGLSDKTQVNLAGQLNGANPDYTARIYQLLTSLRPRNRAVLAQMARFPSKPVQTQH
ncbi:hypothetical protein [Rudanella lutea]|uniref:hypothetical protein n=1 Tax=Rudanella lutea TaxID=451374 RepID=UPI00037F54EA|nr:hypothetical protein [Rudanella lutea]